ncbi:TIGR02301 family protein [Pelagibacterium halotolerans]|uniref:TIGR02301 family protein n=1 Tax=Pelagibacterium halotolerans TaxID=531813 RepID=UPI0005A013A1|nr:TIGR02301 family protein [Pelagibacterium halotolerans]QJR19444.1 TIGR02301 family protein [Pelagibacterium halotolerans]SDZ91144.1 TIGR02301 family protein [Pelagibacterium halotolerans]
MRPVWRLCLLALLAAPSPVLAVDPPYQGQMERLSEILGSLYMLTPLCGDRTTDWRGQMAELIDLDEPDDDRRARLAGAFNAGYEAYARFYRSCTPSAEIAITRLLTEGETLARDIHQRYAE